VEIVEGADLDRRVDQLRRGLGDPASSGSRLDGTPIVALKPPETPAKAAAMPASGWRPAA
jgi:hypothetical protein